MLSKAICIKCKSAAFSDTVPLKDWTPISEMRWNINKMVSCWILERDDNYSSDKCLLSIYEKPHDKCLYTVEHLVSDPSWEYHPLPEKILSNKELRDITRNPKT